jgi:hypothetical protein
MDEKLGESSSLTLASKLTGGETPVPGHGGEYERVRKQIVVDGMEWLKWLKGRQDPQTKLLRDLVILASEAL